MTAAGLPATDSGSSIGLAAARRAVRVTGEPPRPHRPLVVQLVPPENLAVGTVPWGLGRHVPAGSYREISTATPAGELAAVTAGLLAEAASGRTLILVVRDAHRHQAAAEIVRRVLAARPDAVVAEMGLPVWQPPAGTFLATYGAARSSGQAAAEILGLAAG